MKTRLRWWFVAWLSIILTAGSVYYYGPAIQNLDLLTVLITSGIVIYYFIVTGWIGLALHTSMAMPSQWARDTIGRLQALGLVGALLGMVQSFGLVATADVIDTASILASLGLVLFSTLAGIIYAEFLILQLRVIGDDED
jgi:hypothetical protein